jgi:hypothetical protein
MVLIVSYTLLKDYGIGAGDHRGGIGLFGLENCERRAYMRLGDYTLESLPTTTITICRRRHV